MSGLALLQGITCRGTMAGFLGKEEPLGRKNAIEPHPRGKPSHNTSTSTQFEERSSGASLPI